MKSTEAVISPHAQQCAVIETQANQERLTRQGTYLAINRHLDQ